MTQKRKNRDKSESDLADLSYNQWKQNVYPMNKLLRYYKPPKSLTKMSQNSKWWQAQAQKKQKQHSESIFDSYTKDLVGLNTKVIDEEEDENLTISSLDHLNINTIKPTDILNCDSDRLAKINSIYNSTSKLEIAELPDPNMSLVPQLNLLELKKR